MGSVCQLVVLGFIRMVVFAVLASINAKLVLGQAKINALLVKQIHSYKMGCVCQPVKLINILILQMDNVIV